jgi:hypothetical protein
MPSHLLPIGHPWRGGELDLMLVESGAEIISDKGHLKIRVPGATDLLTLSKSPSDLRAEGKAISDFRHITGLVKREATAGERREKKVKHEQEMPFLHGVQFSREKKATFQEQLAAILPSLLLAADSPAVIALTPALEKLKETLSEMIFSGMTAKQIAERAGGIEPAVVAMVIRRLFGKGLREIRKELDAKPVSRSVLDERDFELRVRAGFERGQMAEHYKVSEHTIGQWCEKRWGKTFTVLRGEWAPETYELLLRATQPAVSETVAVRMPLDTPAAKPTPAPIGVTQAMPTLASQTISGTLSKGQQTACLAPEGFEKTTNGHAIRNGTYSVGSKDKHLECLQCREQFLWSQSSQEFFAGNGWHPPKRCPKCRRER